MLIVALDLPSAREALSLVDTLGDLVLWYKVGLQLYLAAGPQVVQELRSRGKQVFLDLKLHDIPNTVAGAVRALSGSGAGLLTIHASGGPAMLAAAAAAASLEGAPKLLAVTVLTSMEREDLAATGISSTPASQVVRLATLAVQSGIPGLVCSPQEVGELRLTLGAGPLLVVPGIRAASQSSDDQRRTASAADAIRAGASMLVIGRPIVQAVDPKAVVQSVLEEIEQALG